MKTKGAIKKQDKYPFDLKRFRLCAARKDVSEKELAKIAGVRDWKAIAEKKGYITYRVALALSTSDYHICPPNYAPEKPKKPKDIEEQMQIIIEDSIIEPKADEPKEKREAATPGQMLADTVSYYADLTDAKIAALTEEVERWRELAFNLAATMTGQTPEEILEKIMKLS